MRTWQKIDHVVEKIQSYMCFGFFSVIVVLGTIQVFGRYLFNYSLSWSEEVMRFNCIWLVFVGSSLTIRKDGHVFIDALPSMIKNLKVKTTLYVIARLCCIVFLVCLFPASIELIMKTKTSLAASLPLPFSFVYASFSVGVVMSVLSYISVLPRDIMSVARGEK